MVESMNETNQLIHEKSHKLDFCSKKHKNKIENIVFGLVVFLWIGIVATITIIGNIMLHEVNNNHHVIGIILLCLGITIGVLPIMIAVWYCHCIYKD